MKSSVVLASFLVVAVILGSIREFLFLNLNYAIDKVVNHRSISYAHSAFQAAVDGLGPSDLFLLKWSLAILFIAVMLGMSILLARALFGDHRYARTLVLGFATIGLLALLFHACEDLHPAMEGISVKLLHLLQYPVVLFFLWAGALLQRRSV